MAASHGGGGAGYRETVTPRPGTASQPWLRGWASDSALLLTSQIMTVIATSAAAIFIARTLDPDSWAVFSAFLGLSLALALVSDFGIGTWLLRELSRAFATSETPDDRRAATLLSSGVAVNVALATPLILVAIGWSTLARPGVSTTVALMGLLLYGALTATANALEAHLRSRRRVTIVLSASIIEKLVLILCIGAVYATDAGLAAIGASYLVAGCTRVAFDIAVLLVRDSVTFVAPRPAAVVSTARASLPFALNAGSLNLVPRLDTLVLVLLSTSSAAWFAVGDRVLGPALLIPAVLGSTLYPFMAGSSARRVSPWLLALALGLAGLLLATIGAVLAPFLIPALFGSEYREAVPVAQVMLFSLPLVFTSSTLLVVAYSHGRERALLLPVIAVSLAGTVAIVAGQMTGGASLAAGGYVVRQALFLVAIAVVVAAALRAERRGRAGSATQQSPEVTLGAP